MWPRKTGVKAGGRAERLADGAGFEPATFPVSPGRSHQLFNEPLILSQLETV